MIHHMIPYHIESKQRNKQIQIEDKLTVDRGERLWEWTE